MNPSGSVTLDYRNPADNDPESDGASTRSRSTLGTRSPSPEDAARMNQNQGHPPHQFNMEQLMEMLATLTQQGLNTQGSVTAMANAVHAQIAHVPAARPAPLPNLGPKTFAELDLSEGTEAAKISKLCAWESCIWHNITSIDGMRVDLPLERLVAGILGSLKGECQTMAQGMDPQRYQVGAAHNVGMDRRAILLQFFSDLSNILLGASVPDKAYSLFIKRKQKKGEAIHPYHAELGVLYRKAFPVAWEQPENQRALIRHFLDNLWDLSLAYDVNINQAMPATYPEALQLLEQRQGTMDRYRMNYGDRAGPNLGGKPKPLHQGGGGGGNHGGEPMDVDALRRKGRNQNRGAGAGAGKGAPGKGKNDNKQQGQRREAAPKPPPKNQNASKRGCYNCGDEGHLARDCTRKVHAITRGQREEEEEDTEPEHFSYEREPTSESEDDDWDPDRVVAALEGSQRVTPTGAIRRPRSRTTRRPSPKRKSVPIQVPPTPRKAQPTYPPKVHIGTQGDGSGTVTIDGQMVHVPKYKLSEVNTSLKENMKKELGPGELRRIVKEILSGKGNGRDEAC